MSSHLLQWKSCLALGTGRFDTQSSHQVPEAPFVLTEEMHLVNCIFFPSWWVVEQRRLVRCLNLDGLNNS